MTNSSSGDNRRPMESLGTEQLCKTHIQTVPQIPAGNSPNETTGKDFELDELIRGSIRSGEAKSNRHDT